MRFSRSAISGLMAVVVVSLLLFLNLAMINTDYVVEYVLIVFSFLITVIIFLWSYTGNDKDILHPLSLVTVLYICIFHFCPLYLISIGETTCHGAVVMDGCIKATLLFEVGYLFLILGYKKTKIKRLSPRPIARQINSEKTISKLLVIAYLIWIVGWFVSVVTMIKSGKSFQYIISLGVQGTSSSTFNSFGDEGGIAFLGKMANCMVIPWIVICFVGNNIAVKIVITLLTISSFYVTGFRYMIVIMALAFAVVWYRFKNKRPKIYTIILFGIIIILFISVLGYARSDIRLGREVDWTDFSFDSIEYALVSNFNIFLPFYGLVTEYPWNHFYTLGHSMFYESAIYFIPRALWSQKPVAKVSSAVAIAIMNSTNEYTIQTVGMAWPNIGEYYMEFGVLGVVGCMFVFGKLLKKSLTLYNSPDLLDVITYGVLLGTFFQLVTRGYMPNNLGLILFLFLPLIPLKLFVRNYKGHNEESENS